MSVAELIARLQEMPQDAQVYIWGDHFPGGYEELSDHYMEYHDDSDLDYLPGVWLG